MPDVPDTISDVAKARRVDEALRLHGLSRNEPEPVEDANPFVEESEPEEDDDVRSLEHRTIAKVIDTGMSFNDPEIAELSKKVWRDARDYWSSVGAVLDKRAKQQRLRANIGEGAKAATPGRTAPATSVDDAARQLAAIQSGAMGSPSSPANRAKRAKLLEIVRGG